MRTPYNSILMLSWNVYAGYSLLLAGCTPASVSESQKWTQIVQNMVNTKSDILQLLKGKQLHSTLYGAYIEVVHGMTAVLKESSIKGEMARPQLLHLCPSRNSMNKEGKNRNLQMTPTKKQRRGVSDPQLYLKPIKAVIGIFHF
jgi:hypothetical protein